MLTFHPGDYDVWSDGSREPKSIHYHKALYRVIRGADHGRATLLGPEAARGCAMTLSSKAEEFIKMCLARGQPIQVKDGAIFLRMNGPSGTHWFKVGGFIEPGDEGWDAAVSQAVNHLLAREAADKNVIDTWIAARPDWEEA